MSRRVSSLEPHGADGLLLQLRGSSRVNVLDDSLLTHVEELLTFAARRIERGEARWLGVVSPGEGPFAAGADLERLARFTPADAWGLARHGRRVFDRLARFPAPTGALVDGAAYGGGFDLATACDLLHATRRARFAHPGVGLGFFTGWGGTHVIPDRARGRRGAELLLSGRPIGPFEARDAGIVSRVVPRQQGLETLAEDLGRLARWPAPGLDAFRWSGGEDRPVTRGGKPAFVDGCEWRC